MAGGIGGKANKLLEDGDAQGAAQAYREALRLDPNNSKTHYNLALALNKLGDHAGERQALEQAVRLDPKFALAHNQLGLSLLSDGKLPEAENELQAALAIDPQFAEAQNNLGTLYGQEGKNEVAEKLFRQAVESNPQYTQAYLNLGLTLAAVGRFTEAEQEIDKVLQLAPNRTDAMTAMGMVQVKLGKFPEAHQTFRKVIALEPSSAEGHLNLGIALADGFDLEGALEEFSVAVRLAPKAAAARYNRGRALFDLHRYEEAKTELETGSRLDPNLPSALYVLALIERQASNDLRCAELLRKVVALEPDNTNAMALLSQSLLRMGKMQEAIGYWEQALKVDPEYGEALYNLSRALSKEDPERAKRYQERFIAFQSKRQIIDRAETLGNFALSAANARDWPQAIAQLKEALEVCRDCRSRGDLHKNLGLIYCRSGDLKHGEEQLGVALKLKPQDADVLKALSIIETLRTRQAHVN